MAPPGISVNNLAPGIVLTPMNQQLLDDPQARAEAERKILMRRAAQPAEIARLVLFLASSDSDYVTGSTYTMNGGFTRQTVQGA